MLQIRPVCEHCGKPLPPDDEGAMICSFECTFCAACAENVLQNVCPNCGGGFEKRPVRPVEMLVKYPPATLKIHNPVNTGQFETMLMKYKDIAPARR
ncbi:MAG: DUF1272 domain-containing protein [Chitinophagaceae bacterium]